MSSTVGAVLGTVVGGLVIGALLRCPTREMMANNFFSNENVKILVTDSDGNLVVKSTDELKQYIDAKTDANTNLITGAGGVNQRIGNIDGPNGSIKRVNDRITDSKTRLKTIETVMPEIESEIESLKQQFQPFHRARSNQTGRPIKFKAGWVKSYGNLKDITWSTVNAKLRGRTSTDRFVTYNELTDACIQRGLEEGYRYVGVRKTEFLNHPNSAYAPCFFQQADERDKFQGVDIDTSWNIDGKDPSDNVTYCLKNC